MSQIVNEIKLRQELEQALEPLKGLPVDGLGHLHTVVEDVLRPYREQYPDYGFLPEFNGSVLTLEIRRPMPTDNRIRVRFGLEVKFCGRSDVHARHEWTEGYYDTDLRLCHGVMIVPVDAWNGNVDSLVKYRTALEEIAAGTQCAMDFDEAWKIAVKALGRKP